MRKNIKLIIGIVIGMIVVSGVSVYAAITYKYTSGDISYTKEGTSAEISVENALNELYSIKKDFNTNINKTDATASDIKSGKKAYTSNGLITGTHTEDYVSGIYNHDANTPFEIDFGFVPSKFQLLYKQGDVIFVISYDVTQSTSVYRSSYANTTEAHPNFSIDNTSVKWSDTSADWYRAAYSISYIACK